MTYQMPMAIGVANSNVCIYTCSTDSQMYNCILIYVCPRMSPTMLDIGSQFYPEHQLCKDLGHGYTELIVSI